MDKPGGNEAGKVLKKGKKKHAKDELDRQKQAEKKRRRLEKALANSAAIISALEKKRQQKKEQEKQDEEGAAIAEAVALHVLIDESDDYLIMNKHRRCNRWDDVVGLEITPVLQGMDSYSSSRLAYAAHACVPQWRWADWGISGPFSSRGHMMDYQAPWHQRTCPPSDGCTGFIAAQAVSSLQIGDHSSEETFPQTDGFHGFIAAQAVSSLQIGDHCYEDTFPRADGCPGFTAAHAVSSLQIGGHTSGDVFPIQGGGGTAVLHRILNNANNRLNLYKEL